jgi:PKD repeat protein
LLEIRVNQGKLTPPTSKTVNMYSIWRSCYLLVVIGVALLAAACGSSPDAEFTQSSDGGEAPLEVQFSPVSQAANVSYHWEFGDGGTSDEATPAHSYVDAGEFAVRLTVSRGDRSSSFEKKVSVSPGEAGWVTVEPSVLTLQSGDRVQLKASAFDEFGNPVPDATFVWSSDVSVGTILDDGTFIAGPTIGTFDQVASVEFERSGKTVSTTIAADIVYGLLDSVVISPLTINLRANDRVDLAVLPRDRQGHVLPEFDVEWQVVRNGVDQVLTGGEFQAGTLPTGEEQDLVVARVTVDGITRESVLTGSISPGILDRVELKADTKPGSVDVPMTLVAVGYDRFGNMMNLDSVKWELLSDSYGSISRDGVFTPSGESVSVDTALFHVTGNKDRVEADADIWIKVFPGIATTISLEPASDSISVGAGNPLTAIVTDKYGNEIENPYLVWTATGAGQVTDDGTFIAGFVTGEFPGAVTVTLPAGASGNLGALSTSADITVRDRSSDMIAVEVSSLSDAGIILIDLATAGIRSLSPELEMNGGVESTPAWWPDGSRLAYTSNVGGKLRIYDIEIETGKIRQLVDDPDGTSMPAISPDGTQIAYVITTGSNWQLYVADLPVPDADGNIVPITREQSTKLSDDDSLQSLLPWWSPDGSTIAFTTSWGLNDVDIRLVPSDGSEPPRVIGELGLAVYGWSTAGDKVLAVDNQNGGGQSLVVVDVSTGLVAGFIPLPFQTFMAAWAPDGSEVTVIDRLTGAMWIADSDGSSLRQVLNRAFVPRRTAWRPVPIDAQAVLAAKNDAPQA